MKKKPICPKCFRNDHVVKRGFYSPKKVPSEKIQRYFCKSCKQTFTIESGQENQKITYELMHDCLEYLLRRDRRYKGDKNYYVKNEIEQHNKFITLKNFINQKISIDKIYINPKCYKREFDKYYNDLKNSKTPMITIFPEDKTVKVLLFDYLE